MPRPKYVPKGRVPNKYGYTIKGRLIRGETFVLHSAFSRKSDAVRLRNQLIKQGRPVRVIKNSGGYGVWMSNERISHYRPR